MSKKLTAGLLVCDHVKAEYQATFGDYPDMFNTLFPELEFKLYDVCNGVFPKNLDECHVYMATGSLHSVYENLDWIVRTKELIRQIYEANKYFIGFCFGHQLLGEALGGKVEKSTKGWCVGVHEFAIKTQQPWMQPAQSQLNVLMMCQDQVMRLPEGAIVLAGNESCPVGMFQVGETMLGIQGHPEFSKAYDRFLVEARVERMGKATVEAALESLEKPVDREVIRDWMKQFLNA